MDTDPKNGVAESFFPKGTLSSEKVFPFPIFFEKQPKGEWKKLANSRQCPQPVKKLYNLLPFANEMQQTPLVDAPVLAIQSSGLLSEDGHGSIRDH